MTGTPDALLAEQHGSQQEQGLQHAQGYAQVDSAHPPLPGPGRHRLRHYLRAWLPYCFQSQPLRQLQGIAAETQWLLWIGIWSIFRTGVGVLAQNAITAYFLWTTDQECVNAGSGKGLKGLQRGSQWRILIL